MPDDMPRCRDCRWWLVIPAQTDTFPDGWGGCMRFKDLPPPPGQLACPMGFDEDRAAMFTAPDFGCTQFEPKALSQDRSVYATHKVLRDALADTASPSGAGEPE